MKSRKTAEKKRILALLISAVMIVTCFPGMTVFAEDSPSGDSVSEPAAEETTQNPDEVTSDDPAAEEDTSADPEASVLDEGTAEAATEIPTIDIKAEPTQNAENLESVEVTGSGKEFKVYSKLKPGAISEKEQPVTTLKLTITASDGCTVDTNTIKADENSMPKASTFVSLEGISVKEDSNMNAYVEVPVTLNGTGDADLTFSVKGNEKYKVTVSVEQRRPTYVYDSRENMNSDGIAAGLSILNYGYPVKYKKTVKVKVKKKWKKVKGKWKYKYKKKKKKITLYETAYRNLEICSESGQSVDGYARVQGGATDGTYSYNALVTAGSDTYAKISKVDLSTHRVVAVSAPLNINHGNDITYNSSSGNSYSGKLIVTHNDANDNDPNRSDIKRTVTVVDPNSLTVEGSVVIDIPDTLYGATRQQLKDIKGFASVTYMDSGFYKGCYVAIISSSHNFLILDKDFNAIRYVEVSWRYDNTKVYYQGAASYGNYILVGVYPRSSSYYNVLCIYDVRTGNYKGNVRVRVGDEIENIYHAGDTFYAGFYHAYTHTWYTKEKKKVKVKWKKKHGKWKYKWKKKKVTVKHSKYMREGYIYNIGNIGTALPSQ